MTDLNVEVVMKTVFNGKNWSESVTIASFSSKPDEAPDASDKAAEWIFSTFGHWPKAAIRIVNTDTHKIVGSVNWYYNEETGEEE